MSTSPDQILLTAEQKEQLARLADELGMSWDALLGKALAAYRHKTGDSNGKESFYDAASRLGLLGCVHGGPSDLSTNPKHLEGFAESES